MGAAAPCTTTWHLLSGLQWRDAKALYNSFFSMWYQPDVRFPDSSEPVPGPRAAHSCNLIGNKLFVFGGWNGKKGLNDLNVLNVDTMEWSLQRVMELFVAFNSQHGCVVVRFSFLTLVSL